MPTFDNHEAEKEILRVVCSEFVETLSPTLRSPLVKQNPRNLQLLSELERGLLHRVGDRLQQLLPTLEAFCLCGDQNLMKLARGGVLAVLRGARQLYMEDESDKGQYSFQELMDKLAVLGIAVDEKQARLGLYLIQEFGVVSGWSADNSEVPENFHVFEQIVTVDDPEKKWDEYTSKYSFPTLRPPPIRHTLGDPYDEDENDHYIADALGTLSSTRKAAALVTSDSGINRPLIFISCGQRTEEERNLGSQIANLINSTQKFSAYFADTQSNLRGLHENILEQLERCAGFIAVMHPRGTVSFPNGESLTRASVWVEQEIAIAAFIQHTKKSELMVAAFCHRGVGREGLRDLLHLNPTPFDTSEDILSSLRDRLHEWTGVSLSTISSRGEGVTISLTAVPGSSVPGVKTYLIYTHLTNIGKVRLKEYSATISVPTQCLSWSSASYVAEIPAKMNGYRSFRNTEKSFANVAIHPGDRIQVVSIEISVDNLKPEERETVLGMDIVGDVEAEGAVLQSKRLIKDLLDVR
jgi:hypothetical protein